MSDEIKSCIGCPSYMGPEDAINKFRKSVGAPVCGLKGTILGKPGLGTVQANKLAMHIASRCDDYGKPATPLPRPDWKMEVAMPVIESVGAPVEEDLKNACSTCSSCKWFVRDDVMAKDFGWTAGLCSAKGRLILPNRQVSEAKACDIRQFGAIRTSTIGVHLLPEYEDAFNLSVDPVRAYFKAREESVEPHEYPTDRPVSEADTKSGIRAWRAIKDPAGSGNTAFLPCYDPDFFDANERAKIPRSGDDEHPELYVDHFGGAYLAAVTWTELDETPALWGEPGTGKTELFRYLAWMMCLPFERVSLTMSSEIDDLAGKMRYSPEEGTYFQYGRIPAAWKKPCVLVLDEANTSAPEIWQFIRPLTDNSKQLVLDMNESETIKRHTDCYLGFAMNPSWDMRNVGTQQIGDADANRLFHVYIELPPPLLEREIIRNRVKLDGWEIDDARLNTLMSVAEELRGHSKNGTLPVSWGIRPQIKVARALRWFEPITAYRRAIGDFLEPEALEVLLDVVRAHVESGD